MDEIARSRTSRAWCRAQGKEVSAEVKLPGPQDLIRCLSANFVSTTIYRARLLLAIGIYCEMGLSKCVGASTDHNYLVAKLGISHRTAFEYCQVGRRLLEFDYLSEVFCSGKLSYYKVRKLIHYLSQENEHELVDLAVSLTYDGLEEQLAGKEKNEEPDEEEYFRVSVDDDTGKVHFSGTLNPDHGAQFLAALKIGELAQLRDVGCDEAEEIFQGRDAKASGRGEQGTATEPAPKLMPVLEGELVDSDESIEEDLKFYDFEPVKHPQQRSPSFSLQDVLAPPESQPSDQTDVPAAEKKKDAARESVTRFGKTRRSLYLDALFGVIDVVRSQPRSTVRAPGAQVNVIVKENGQMYLPDQLGADPRQVMRLILDGAFRYHWVDHNGNHLALGREHRLVTKDQEFALLARWNYRCAMPGCDHSRFLEFHHIFDWASGGETDMDNLLPLCAGCHALVTRGLVKIYVDEHDPRLLRFEFPSGDCFTSIGRTPPRPNDQLPFDAQPRPHVPERVFNLEAGEVPNFDDVPVSV